MKLSPPYSYSVFPKDLTVRKDARFLKNSLDLPSKARERNFNQIPGTTDL
jgi:hypothetical protein